MTVPNVVPRSPPHGVKMIVPQSSVEMPCRRSHQAAAKPNGNDTAHKTVVTTTPVISPAFTRPSPSERASLGPRRTMTTSATRLAIVPSSHT